MSGVQTYAEMIDQPAATDAEVAVAVYPILVPGTGGAPATTKLATGAQLTSTIITGNVVLAEQSVNVTPIAVAGLPTVASAGGVCLLTGTITAQDVTTRDTAMWNITLLVRRTPDATSCTTVGDTTPSEFIAQGTLANLTPPALGANATGPTIILTGIASTVTWNINLSTTTGD